ncbi:type II toxin-antitoxin system YhaV family toxin [soil metagenome]
MSPRRPRPLVVGEWTILAHPLFLAQLAALEAKVEAHRAKDPLGYRSRNDTKRLYAIRKLILHDIPASPGAPAFRQGATLGASRKFWFRAKFFQQYRLFFRFDSAARIIVIAWVNDERSLRACGAADDAYKVFARMLDQGNPPDAWAALLSQALHAGGGLAKLSGG